MSYVISRADGQVYSGFTRFHALWNDGLLNHAVIPKWWYVCFLRLENASQDSYDCFSMVPMSILYKQPSKLPSHVDYTQRTTMSKRLLGNFIPSCLPYERWLNHQKNVVNPICTTPLWYFWRCLMAFSLSQYNFQFYSSGCWFGTWLLWLSIILGISSSQLTKSYFSEG